MNKAEDKAAKKALEKFPILFSERMGYDKTNLQQERRNAYEKGYQQAEKDLELTWENMRELYIIFAEVDTEIELCKANDIKAEIIGYYEEVLKRFKNLKK